MITFVLYSNCYCKSDHHKTRGLYTCSQTIRLWVFAPDLPYFQHGLVILFKDNVTLICLSDDVMCLLYSDIANSLLYIFIYNSQILKCHIWIFLPHSDDAIDVTLSLVLIVQLKHISQFYLEWVQTDWLTYCTSPSVLVLGPFIVWFRGSVRCKVTWMPVMSAPPFMNHMNNWGSSRLSAPAPSRVGMQSESHLFSHLLCLCLSPSCSLSHFLALSLSLSNSPSLPVSLSPGMHTLPQSLSTYCQYAAVKFCAKGAEIASEELMQWSGWWASGWERRGRKEGEQRRRLLSANGSLSAWRQSGRGSMTDTEPRL